MLSHKNALNRWLTCMMKDGVFWTDSSQSVWPYNCYNYKLLVFSPVFSGILSAARLFLQLYNNIFQSYNNLSAHVLDTIIHLRWVEKGEGWARDGPQMQKMEMLAGIWLWGVNYMKIWSPLGFSGPNAKIFCLLVLFWAVWQEIKKNTMLLQCVGVLGQSGPKMVS